jgi:hypothetical protein
MLVLSTSHGTLKQDTSAYCRISSVIIIIIPQFDTSSLNKETRGLSINLVEENAAN